MPSDEVFPALAYPTTQPVTRAEWPNESNCFLRREAIPGTLLGALEFRAGLEEDLIKIRSLVVDMHARQPVDLPAVLNSLKHADRLATQVLQPCTPRTKTGNRFEKQRLLQWMSEFSVARQDAIYSSVKLVRNIQRAELGLLLLLERYERDTRTAIHLIDEHLLDSEPRSVEEACGLLTFIGGLLSADTTIEYSFFATLVVECVRIIEANIGVAVKTSEPTASLVPVC